MNMAHSSSGSVMNTSFKYGCKISSQSNYLIFKSTYQFEMDQATCNSQIQTLLLYHRFEIRYMFHISLIFLFDLFKFTAKHSIDHRILVQNQASLSLSMRSLVIK